jgi:inhibitor of cysteine peptidase
VNWSLRLLVVGAAFLLSACAASASNLRRLTERNLGLSLELQPGDRFEVVLSGNPTAGYQWEDSFWDETVLKLLSQPNYKQRSAAVGSGGEFAFTFEAVAVGQTKVELVYRRPFERTVKPSKTFEITAVVK